jgi:histidinol-phosphatase (PHP family)
MVGMKTNYHTHCSLCDGIADPETVVLAAIEKDFDILGFSSHSPLEGEDWTLSMDGVSDYISQIRGLQEKYKNQIQILLGMERDFIPSEPLWPVNRWDNMPLDYTIGSVHMIEVAGEDKLLSVDGPESDLEELIGRVYKGDARLMVEAYYDTVALMVSRETMDFIGHLDVVKKRNRSMGFLNEDAPWYRKKVNDVLDIIEKKGQRLEINTGGISRGATDSLYPSQPILRECFNRSIPIVINSDSHNPEFLDGEFPLAREAAKEAGYREHWILDHQGWRPLPL